MRKIIFFSLLLHAVFPVIAQDPSSNNDTATQSLNEVVITARRSQQKNINVPYSVNTMSAQLIGELNPRTTPEALMGMTGVFVQKTNHGGGSPFVRGLTGNQTLILVDGIRLNNSTFRYGPNQYLNTIDAYTISRIEVAKGTGSVQYGTDAIGGVVHIITRDPRFTKNNTAVNARLTGKYMTGHMEYTVRGEMEYRSKKFALLAGVSKKDFGDIIGGDTTGRQFPSGYDEWSYDIKAGLLLKENIKLILANHLLQQRHVPVYHKIQLENFNLNEMDPQKRLLSYARLNISGSSLLLRETELTLSFQHGAEGRNSQKRGDNILRKERDKVNTVGLTADVQSIMTKQWTANSGIEMYWDKVSSFREDLNRQSGIASLKRGLYPDGSTYNNFSLYSLHHLHFGRWMVDAGLRFNTFLIHISDTTLGNVRITPAAWVGNVALMYVISDRQTIYASYSSGYRAPNIDDMGTLGIVDFRYELPSAGLEPEKSGHTELGYKVQVKKFNGSVAIYYMHLSNLITRIKEEGQIINGYPVYRKENTEAAFIKGAEAAFGWQATKYIHLDGGLSYTFGQNLTKNEPLRRIPPFNGRLMATYRMQQWFTAAGFQFALKQDRLAQGDKEDNRIPAGGTPGWNIVNLYGGYTTGRIRMGIGLQNLFNRDYRTHGSGINGVGRSGWASVTIII